MISCMKQFNGLVTIFLFLLLSDGVRCFSQEDEEAKTIRSFPIATIEKLGRELFERDGMAAQSFDLLFEAYPDAKEKNLRGWVTELGEATSKVYMLKAKEEDFRLAYVVVFEKNKKPRVEAHLDEPLPEEIAKRFSARVAAIGALPGFYDRPYNFEVLDDPDGEGYVVYSLVASRKAHEMVVGGHSRISLAADAKTVKSVDALSNSLLILDKREGQGQGQDAVGSIVSHVVSDTPVETHVFLSLMHRQSLFVVTSDGAIWNVEEGKVTKTEMNAKDQPDKPDEESPEPDPAAEDSRNAKEKE